MLDAPQGHLFEAYPATPGALASSAFRVTVDGESLSVEAYAGVSYVRFAFRGVVELEIQVAGEVGPVRLLPRDAAMVNVADHGSLRLTLAEPRSFVAWVGDREKLFVFADPPEEPPVVDEVGVIAVAPAERGADTAGLATRAIQSAIDRVAARPGGGTVVLLPGRFVTGTITVPSHVTLYVSAGALLEGSADPADYPVDPGCVERGRDETLEGDARFYGRTMTFSRLVLVDNATDVRICGRGTISGSGRVLRTRHNAVPNLVRVRQSSDVRIQDVLLRDAAAWTLHLLASDRIDVSNVRIVNDRDNLNTDGIDPDMSTRVHIDRAFVYTKDDGICIKASRNGELEGDVADVRVTDSVLSSRDAALKVGTESSATVFRDITFERCWVFESGRAMSVVVRDGAAYERIAFRGIFVDGDVDHLVEQVIGVRDPEAALGTIRELSFEDVEAPDHRVPASAWTWYAQFRPGRPPEGAPVPVFAGADERHGVDGLRLRNVVVNGTRLTSIEEARAVGLTIGPYVDSVDIG
jgi:hypothetical protein